VLTLSEVWRDDDSPGNELRVWSSSKNDVNLIGAPVYPGDQESGEGCHLIIRDSIVTADDGGSDGEPV